MTEYILPLTNDPRQVMTLDLTIDGEGFHARIEVRYLPAPGCWVISVWDEAAGELLINHPADLLLWLRQRPGRSFPSSAERKRHRLPVRDPGGG